MGGSGKRGAPVPAGDARPPLAAARRKPDASAGAAARSASSGECIGTRHAAGESARGSGGVEPCAHRLPHSAPPLSRTEPSVAVHLPARSTAASPLRRRRASSRPPAGGDLFAPGSRCLQAPGEVGGHGSPARGGRFLARGRLCSARQLRAGGAASRAQLTAAATGLRSCRCGEECPGDAAPPAAMG